MSGKRNVVLMLAEGDTDLTTLEPALTTFLRGRGKRLTTAEPFRCDVTTMNLFQRDARNAGIMPPYDDARHAVDDFVQRHVKDSLFKPSEYAHVIQLIDLDGAFIPPDKVEQDESLTGVRYQVDGIVAPDRQRLLDIHDEKRRQVERLLAKRTVPLGYRLSVPYHLYYMSRNLEHALSGIDQVLTQPEKQANAAKRAVYYAADPMLLMNDLIRLYQPMAPLYQPIIPSVEWQPTWDYAMTGLHSLERGSNLALMPSML